MTQTHTYRYIIEFKFTCLVQGVGHALACRFLQLCLHDAQAGSTWVAICSRTLPLYPFMPVFGHLARDILWPSHPDKGPLGMQDGMYLLTAPHRSHIIAALSKLDFKRENELKRAEQSLSHGSQLGHIVIVGLWKVQVFSRNIQSDTGHVQVFSRNIVLTYSQIQEDMHMM